MKIKEINYSSRDFYGNKWSLVSANIVQLDSSPPFTNITLNMTDKNNLCDFI